MCVIALHTVPASPSLRVVAGRLRGGLSVKETVGDNRSFRIGPTFAEQVRKGSANLKVISRIVSYENHQTQ